MNVRFRLHRMPQLLTIAGLWSMVYHPSVAREWTLRRKIAAAARAGFNGITATLTPEHRRWAGKYGLTHLLGMIETDGTSDATDLIRAQKEGGARHINVQLGRHDTPPKIAVQQWIRMERAAERLGGVILSLEVHRNRCTETPEKTYEIAERYEKATGRLLKFNFDFSHLAVVKHLTPPEYGPRLLTHPALIQHAEQIHFRPFNGHHCQVPVTHRGRLTPETLSYLEFAKAVMSLWRGGAQNAARTLFACPEMGPMRPAGAGYNITGLPPAWPDAIVLRGELERSWRSLDGSTRELRQRPPAK